MFVGSKTVNEFKTGLYIFFCKNTNVHDFEKIKNFKKNVCRFKKLFTDSKVFYV